MSTVKMNNHQNQRHVFPDILWRLWGVSPTLKNNLKNMKKEKIKYSRSETPTQIHILYRKLFFNSLPNQINISWLLHNIITWKKHGWKIIFKFTFVRKRTKQSRSELFSIICEELLNDEWKLGKNTCKKSLPTLVVLLLLLVAVRRTSNNITNSKSKWKKRKAKKCAMKNGNKCGTFVVFEFRWEFLCCFDFSPLFFTIATTQKKRITIVAWSDRKSS